MENLLLKKRIYQVQPPPETLEKWEDEMEVARTQWGKYFKNNEEFELFAMLPLTDEQRWKVLRAVGEEQRFKDEVRACTGKIGSDKEHRKFCISCVLKERRQI